MLIDGGNEPFYLMKLRKITKISLKRLNDLKKIFIEENIIEFISEDMIGNKNLLKRYYGLTEKGRKIQERLVEIDRLIKED